MTAADTTPGAGTAEPAWARPDTVRSPRIGVVHGRYRNWRSGDHSPEGLLLVRGPGMARGARHPDIDMIDLAPSLAARLGVDLPDVDGIPVPWLATANGTAA
jgi:hypothetical protein